MKPSRQFSAFSASTTTVTYTYHNDHNTPTGTIEIPIDSSPPPRNQLLPSKSATRIQSAYRAHQIRTLYKIILSVNQEADRLQSEIQRQETVDSIRSNEKEKLRINETLMGLLLRLDSVPGYNPEVREARRKVSRRLVGLQEIIDGVSEVKAWGDVDGFDWWDPFEVVAEMEEKVCKERGGEELERFCEQYLGFRCLQRFLRQP